MTVVQDPDPKRELAWSDDADAAEQPPSAASDGEHGQAADQ
jgi:hypothetical protein